MLNACSRDTGFLDREVDIGTGRYLYQVFVPRGYSSSRRWPLILFLHGSGERGSNGLQQTETGLAAAIRRNKDNFPALVAFPQVPLSNSWLAPDMTRLAMRTVLCTMREFSIDRERVCLTGLSMGGTGVWHLGARYPKWFSCLVAICSGLQFPAAQAPPPEHASNSVRAAEIAERVRHLPCRIYHGARDPVVPVGFSRLLFNALSDRGAEVAYTEFPDDGHAIWDKVYDNEALCAWMINQSRNANAV